MLEKNSYDSLSKEQKLIYLAGVFEGEGSFGFWGKENKKKQYFRTSIEMTDKDIILRFYDYFKIGNICKNKIRNNKKQSWTWGVNGVNAKELLLLFYPYLGKRRKEKFEQCYPFYKQLPHLRKSYSTQLIKQSQIKILQLN